MINHRHKWIFVHIPKTAGTSIEFAFRHAGTKYELGVGGKHTYAKAFEASLGSDFAKYFKFSFVRNPWDLTVSWYHFLNVERRDGLDFKGFLITYYPAISRKICPTNPLVTKKRVVRASVAKDMRNTLYLPRLTNKDGKIRMDFIGKFENLQEDFNTVCGKIGIQRRKLPHKNKSKHKHYTEYYDEESKQIVAEKYAKDIEHFGYEFGK